MADIHARAVCRVLKSLSEVHVEEVEEEQDEEEQEDWKHYSFCYRRYPSFVGDEDESNDTVVDM